MRVYGLIIPDKDELEGVEPSTVGTHCSAGLFDGCFLGAGFLKMTQGAFEGVRRRSRHQLIPGLSRIAAQEREG